MEIQISSFNEALKEKIDLDLINYSIETVGVSDMKPPIAFYVLDEDKNLIAALVTQFFWGALHVKNIFVAKAHRKHGIATKLMQKAFDYEEHKNCRFAFVETLSFQALEFYKKLGFKEEFCRDGFTHNVSVYYLKLDKKFM